MGDLSIKRRRSEKKNCREINESHWLELIVLGVPRFSENRHEPRCAIKAGNILIS
jgi:hypothetical protein